MINGRPPIWIFLVGLLVVVSFASLPETWDKILTLTAPMSILVIGVVEDWESWRKRRGNRSSSAEVLRRLMGSWTLLPVLALGLLSLGTLAPMSGHWDKVISWIAIAAILIYLGSPFWEYHCERQADRSSSPATPSSDQT
jgi:predicted permease